MRTHSRPCRRTTTAWTTVRAMPTTIDPVDTSGIIQSHLLAHQHTGSNDGSRRQPYASFAKKGDSGKKPRRSALKGGSSPLMPVATASIMARPSSVGRTVLCSGRPPECEDGAV